MKNFLNTEQIIAMAPGHIYWLDVNGIYQGYSLSQACACPRDARLGHPSRHRALGNGTSLWRCSRHGLGRPLSGHCAKRAITSHNGFSPPRIFSSHKLRFAAHATKILRLPRACALALLRCRYA